MIKYNTTRARKAVQLLVDVAHFGDYVNTLRKNIQRPRALPYKDDKEVLNELLVIGRQDIDAFDNLVAVAQHKRSSPDAKKSEYQKEFMAQKRKRDIEACRLEQLLTGKRMSLDERHKFLVKQHAVWNEEKSSFLEQHGELSWKERNVATKIFWQAQDEYLAERIAEAQAAQDRHELNKRKRTVVVTPPKLTVMRAELRKALDKRK